jgi:hypothetical protein
MRQYKAINHSNNKRFGMRRRGGQAGQSLIVAVIVLFLLLFLGGIFVALVARNLFNAQRAGNVSSASGFAEAGLRYLDEQLTTSPEGADWRPVPDSLPAGAPQPPGYAPPDPGDPDYFWIKPYDDNPQSPTYRQGGFTRVTFGGPTPSQGNVGGRALVRITYRPNLQDPTSKYLKLESIGRVGVINERDPTTYGNSEEAGLRRELVAYKAIGITDYVRSIWNKDNKPVTVALGAPFQVYDRDQQRPIVSEYAGPIRVNANLLWYGPNTVFLEPRRNDAVEVAGTIEHNTDSANPTRVTVTNQETNQAADAAPSNATDAGGVPLFDTLNGLYRDGLAITDRNGAVRSVARLAPPVIDAPTGTRGLTRYRALTRNSPPMSPRFLDPNAPLTFNRNYAGIVGWGSGLYINNRSDLQSESSNLFGVYSLRGDWLQPNAPTGQNSYWRGDFLYVPPAVTIELTPGYMRITKSPYDRREGRFYSFREPNNSRIEGNTIIRYSGENEPDVDRGVRNKYRGYPAKAPGTVSSDGDYVIYAEGNIRIRGVVGGRDAEGDNYVRHLTVVSNGTIYVDGNLLRDNFGPNDQGRGESSIALLARDYVAVNTTQFLSPLNTAQWSSEETTGTGNGPFYLGLDHGETFPFHVTLGPVNESNEPPDFAPESPLSIFFRHASAADGTDQRAVINLLINGPATAYNFAPFPGGGAATGPPNSLFVPTTYADQVFNLDVPSINQALGFDNLLTVAHDPSYGEKEYRMSRVGVAPLDVRIEAFIYAQEGSFFIIPGPWFNPDPNDTFTSYFSQETLPDGSTRPRERRADPTTHPRFPFYREPMDIRLTIYGTVAENLPAQIGDQGAWLEKWGWVPARYGSTGLPISGSTVDEVFTMHGPQGDLGGIPDPATNQRSGNGLRFQFNDRAILPYRPDGEAFRRDRYERILPIAPRLPVAQGLLYFGEGAGQRR